MVLLAKKNVRLSAIELKPLPALPAGEADAAPSTSAATQDTLTPPAAERIPSFFTSSAGPESGAQSALLQEPVLLTKTGQTINKSQAAGRAQVPNKVLADALALFSGHGPDKPDGDAWHGIIDPITLDAPEVAVQVVSAYRNKSPVDGSTSDYVEHHVYDIETLVEWFDIKGISPFSRGAIVPPLQMVPNFAVTNLVRSTQDTPKPALSAGAQHALLAYCVDMSAYMTEKMVSKHTPEKSEHTKTAKVVTPLLLLLGAGSASLLHFSKRWLNPTLSMPAPMPQASFDYCGEDPTAIRYVCEPIYGSDIAVNKSSLEGLDVSALMRRRQEMSSTAGVRVGQTYEFFGCGASAQACNAIEFTMCAGDDVNNSLQSTPRLTGSNLFDACVLYQSRVHNDTQTYQNALNTYFTDVNLFNAQKNHIEHTTTLINITTPLPVVVSLIAAGVMWAYGKKKAPAPRQRPTLRMSADQV